MKTMRWLLVLLVALAVVVSAATTKKESTDAVDEDFDGATGASSSTKFYAIEGQLRPAPLTEGPVAPTHSSTTPARVILYGNGAQQEVLAAQDGSFAIKDVPPGAYLLEVVSSVWHYPQLRIDVSRQGGKIKARVASETKVGQTLPYPLRLSALAPMKFVEERPGMNILGFLKSPMVLMIGVTLLMTVLLPKLMTADAMKELQGQQPQTNQPDPAQLLSKWIDSSSVAAPSKKKLAK